MVRDGTPLHGADLLILARSLGIDVHPRTAGLLKSKVVSITSDQAQVKGRNSGDAFKVYRQVQERLSPAKGLEA